MKLKKVHHVLKGHASKRLKILWLDKLTIDIPPLVKLILPYLKLSFQKVAKKHLTDEHLMCMR